MTANFHHVFPGVGPRSGEISEVGFVEKLSLFKIVYLAQRSLPGQDFIIFPRGQEEFLADLQSLWAAQPDNAQASIGDGSGDGNDRIFDHGSHQAILGLFRLVPGAIRFGDGKNLNAFQEPIADALAGDPGNLIHSDVDDSSFVRVHGIKNLILTGLLHLPGDLLPVFFESSLFFLAKELAIDLDFFGGDLIEEMLES
jgi:hypothetical protein